MKFKKTTLSNGLRIITIPMRDTRAVTIMVLVEAGSKYETKEINGLSHFLEHMCFKGTVKRPSAFAISSELDGIGAQSNAFTDKEYTGYYAKADKKYFTKITDIVSDIYLNSTFPKIDLEKEKGVVIEEINMYEDLPQRKVWENFEELLYGDQPAGWPVIGNKENIKKISQQDLVKYRKNHYVAKSTIIVVAGNVEEKEAVREVKTAFSKVPNGPKKGKKKTIDKQDKPKTAIQFKATDQTHLVLGFRSFDVHDERHWALGVMSTILGKGMSSRLFIKMREELGICYYIHTSSGVASDTGYFAVSAGVGNQRTEEAIEAIMNELKKIKSEGVGEKEIRKAKDFMIGNLSLDLEGSDDYANYYGFQEVLRESVLVPAEHIKKIEAVTGEQIKAVAEDIFKEKGLNLSLIGPFKDDKKFLSHLSI
ncbi:MAG: pitrilysin family protein [bacterium]